MLDLPSSWEATNCPYPTKSEKTPSGKNFMSLPSVIDFQQFIQRNGYSVKFPLYSEPKAMNK